MAIKEMTIPQLVAAAQNYDNLYNEGGDGYNPYREEIERRDKMTSKTMAEAGEFYIENKDRLLETMLEEFQGKIDNQLEYGQVVVYFEDFAICYQSGGMWGDRVGEPVWDNPGADEGIYVLMMILTKDVRFQPLIASKENWKYVYLRTLIDAFCKQYAEMHNIAKYFREEV